MRKLQNLSTQTLIKVNKHLLFLMQFLEPNLSFDMNIRSKPYRLLLIMPQKIEDVFSSRQVFTDFNGNLIYNKASLNKAIEYKKIKVKVFPKSLSRRPQKERTLVKISQRFL